MNNVLLDTHGRGWADNHRTARLRVLQRDMWTLAAGKAYAKSIDDEAIRLLTEGGGDE
jgi:hypothetical protein